MTAIVLPKQMYGNGKGKVWFISYPYNYDNGMGRLDSDMEYL